MDRSGERKVLGRGAGVLSAAGPQARFILFLVLLLVAFTFLLKLFQKLAAIVDLPVFFPIALVALFLFIGIAGTLYSHKFIGPLVRIRKTLDQVAQGDCAVTLRLRDSDDPVLKDLARTVGRLCEHTRECHHLVHETAAGLLAGTEALRSAVRRGASREELEPLLEALDRARKDLETALRSLGR
jgi:hypothetical protein